MGPNRLPRKVSLTHLKGRNVTFLSLQANSLHTHPKVVLAKMESVEAP